MNRKNSGKNVRILTKNSFKTQIIFMTNFAGQNNVSYKTRRDPVVPTIFDHFFILIQLFPTNCLLSVRP